MNDDAVTLAGERETAGITFPEIGKLSGSLEKYRQVNTAAGGLEDKLAQLQKAEGEALDNVGADEEAQCRSLGEIRIKLDVASRRTSHRRLEVSRALGELEQAYPAAETELSVAQSLEFTRRVEILSERVMGVLGLTSEDWQAANFILGAVGASPYLAAIRACSPNANALSMSAEQRAVQLLEQAAKLRAELARVI